MQKELKRFYKTVEVRASTGAFQIALDRHVLKTPAKRDFILPTRSLAEAVAAEWEAQEEKIVPNSMPMMSLVSTTLDNVAPYRSTVVVETADYGAHDLLCYWADSGQPALRRRQGEAWQPLLDWAALELDAALVTTSGIVPAEQSPDALGALRGCVERLDDFELMGVAAATRIAGSLVIALALARGRIDALQASDLSQLDELYQAELWGEDREAVERRRTLRGDLEDIERFLSLLRPA